MIKEKKKWWRWPASHHFRRLKRRFVVSPKQTKIGIWITLSLLFVFAVVMMFRVPSLFSEGPTKWGYLLSASPNELGDTLAGLAGSLAFVWIIVTVMIQSAELKEQRKELKLARQEYAKMADAQNEQVNLMGEQTRLLMKQSDKLRTDQANATFNMKLETLDRRFGSSPDESLKFCFVGLARKNLAMTINDIEPPEELKEYYLIPRPYKNDSGDGFAKRLCSNIIASGNLILSNATERFSQKPDPKHINELREILVDFADGEKTLSDDQRLRSETIGFNAD